MKLKMTAALGFIATILAANYVTTEYGMVPVGFGLVATAGTYFAKEVFEQGPFGHSGIFIQPVAQALPDSRSGRIRVRQYSGDNSPCL
jgi:hypothetical protein